MDPDQTDQDQLDQDPMVTQDKDLQDHLAAHHKVHPDQHPLKQQMMKRRPLLSQSQSMIFKTQSRVQLRMQLMTLLMLLLTLQMTQLTLLLMLLRIWLMMWLKL